MWNAMIERCKQVLETLHLRWTVVRSAALPIICAIVFSYVVGLTAAGREVLFHMAEGGSLAAWGRFVAGLAALTSFAMLVWYTGRALLYVAYPPIEEELARHAKRVDVSKVVDIGESWRRWVPRVAGLLPLVTLAIVYAIDWWRPPIGSEPQRLNNLSAGVAVGTVTAITILAGLYMVYREYLPAWLGGKLDTKRHRHLQIWLPESSRRMGRIFLAIAVLLLVAFQLSKVALPQAIGTAGVVFLSASCIVVLGAVLAHWTNYYRRLSLPGVLLLILLVAGVFARWGLTDNHGIRLLPVGSEAAKGEQAKIHDRVELGQRLAAWLSKRDLAAQGDEPYPVLVVAAQGGGVRAAMWAAAALGTLQDRDPAFACHLFAIVGVSGGSFGSLLFDALLTQQGSADCGSHRASARSLLSPMALAASPGPFASTAYDVFGSDLLAPLAAGMLFPDLVARFAPTARLGVDWLKLPDRQLYLERAVESAWSSSCGDACKVRLDQGFLQASRGSANGADPTLFLVASEVSEGRRWIASQVVVEPKVFVDAVDMLAPESKQPLAMSASAAAGHSARFPWVSPPGGVRLPDAAWSADARHLLDGGVVESSGAATAYEVLYHLRRLCSVGADNILECKVENNSVGRCDGQRCARIRPVVLQLSNDGYDALTWGDSCPVPIDIAQEDGSTLRWLRSWLRGVTPVYPEVSDPLNALLNSRTGRGREAWCRLKHSAGHELLAGGVAAAELEINLEKPDSNHFDERVPLSWTVTRQTKDVMRQRVCEALAEDDFAGAIAKAFGESKPSTSGFIGTLVSDAEAQTRLTISPAAGEARVLFDDLVVHPSADKPSPRLVRRFSVAAMPYRGLHEIVMSLRGSAPLHGANIAVKIGDRSYEIGANGDASGRFIDSITTPFPLDCRLDVEIVLELTDPTRTSIPLALESIDLAFRQPNAEQVAASTN